MDALKIELNSQLTRLVGSLCGGNRSGNFIHVKTVEITYNAKLNDSGFGSILECFNPELLTKLDLESNALSGEKEGNTNKSKSEFLPGLSNLRNLEELNLEDNSIRKLSGGQFKWPGNKLRYLGLSWNSIVELGEGALEFDDEWRSQGLGINFWNNKNLTEFSFHPKSGLERPTRLLSLHLEQTSVSGLHSFGGWTFNGTSWNCYNCDRISLKSIRDLKI